MPKTLTANITLADLVNIYETLRKDPDYHKNITDKIWDVFCSIPVQITVELDDAKLGEEPRQGTD